MPCSDGIDPADFDSGVIDPTIDPTPPIAEVTVDDVEATQDPDGTWWARFQINITNINYIDAIQFNFATANGTGTSGTHYVASSGIHTIPSGQGGDTIDVQILTPGGVTGQKTFFLNLSSPSNCTIVDSQGKATMDYGSGGGPPPPPPPPPDHTKDTAFTGFPKQPCNSGSNSCTIYDQFSNCKYKSACTAYSTAALMSALWYKKHATYVKFDAAKLWRDCPGTGGECDCHSCPGFNPAKMLKYARDTGARRMDNGTFVQLASFNVLSYVGLPNLILKIKQNIIDKGAALMMSKWYGSPNNGWNRCLDCNELTLRNPDDVGLYGSHNSDCTSQGKWDDVDLSFIGLGHAWILTGWNNNKSGGAFEIQSSHGSNWGAGGRCWIPYSFLVLNNSRWEWYSASL